MEPLFTGEEWPSLAHKKATLQRAREHALLSEFSAEELAQQPNPNPNPNPKPNLHPRPHPHLNTKPSPTPTPTPTPNPNPNPNQELAQQRRFVFVDLGSRAFGSSTHDFLRSYPHSSRFDVHAFDMDAAYVEQWQRSANRSKNRRRAHSFTARHAGVSDRDAVITVATGGVNAMKHLGKGAYTGHDRQRAGTEQVPLLNFSRWLQRHVAAEDFVVVKMDIEGSEYEVLPSLLRSRAIKLIDELLLEVHYNRNSWKSSDRAAYCSAARTSQMEPAAACIHRAEAVRWIAFLRALCIHAHEWR